MAYAHPAYLISADELSAGLDGRRILDASVIFAPTPDGGFSVESGLARFNEGHIPGAQFLDLVGDASDTTSDLGFTLPPVAQLEALFRRLGISNDTEVVVYSRELIALATRAWWLLHYCGHRHARVLDGGLEAWQAAGHPLSTEPASYPPGDFTASPNPSRFADRNDVLAAIGDPDIRTVNSLSPEDFAGQGAFTMGRPGHIPGSVNLFFADLLEDGRFKDEAALRQALDAKGRPGHIPGSVNLFFADLLEDGRFKDEAALRQALDAKGLLAAPRVINYCAVGVTATIDAFACLLCGQEDVALYDGSLAEWARDESLPMETGR